MKTPSENKGCKLLRIAWLEEKVMRTFDLIFLLLLICTFLCRRLYMFTAFHERDVCDAGYFYASREKKEKQWEVTNILVVDREPLSCRIGFQTIIL